jgi:predicted Ser/Thr protein kinase
LLAGPSVWIAFGASLKCDEKFLYGLLTLSQEQNIKTGRFSMIYADEVIMSHTKVCATKTAPGRLLTAGGL